MSGNFSRENFCPTRVKLLNFSRDNFWSILCYNDFMQLHTGLIFLFVSCFVLLFPAPP